MVKESQIEYLASQDPFHFHSTNIHGKHFFVLVCVRLCNINVPTGSSHLEKKQTSNKCLERSDHGGLYQGSESMKGSVATPWRGSGKAS